MLRFYLREASRRVGSVLLGSLGIRATPLRDAPFFYFFSPPLW